MSIEGYNPRSETEIKETPILTYKDELYYPRRAFVHALDHFGYKFTYRPDATDSSLMHIYNNDDTGRKVKTLVDRYEKSTLHRLLQDIYEANPEPLSIYLRTQSIEEAHPHTHGYTAADFQHSIVEAFFLSAYERNNQRMQALRDSYREQGHRSSSDIVEFTSRIKIAAQYGGQYNYGRSRGVIAIQSHELPDNLTPHIRQLIREDPSLYIPGTIV